MSMPNGLEVPAVGQLGCLYDIVPLDAMRIATKNVVFVVVLLGVTVTSLVVATCFNFSLVITESKTKNTAYKLEKIDREFTRILDQYQKLAFFLKSDPHLDELLRAFFFTKQLDPIKEKLFVQREIAGFDAIELYDKRGQLVYATTEGAAEESLSLPEGLDVDAVAWGVVCEDNRLKAVFYGHVLGRRSIINGTLVFKKNIDTPFMEMLVGDSGAMIAALEKVNDRLKVRATSHPHIHDFLSQQEITLSEDSTFSSDDFVIDGQHGVAAIKPSVVDAANHELLFFYYEDKKDIERALRQSSFRSMILGVFWVGLGSVLAVIVSRRISRPLKRFTEMVKHVADGDYTQHADVTTKDEVGEMASSLNVTVDAVARAMQDVKDYAEALASTNRALKDSNDAAEAATQAKSAFLANMSHEIRTPMTAILGYADILRTESSLSKGPPACLEAIDTITRNGEHLLNLINDILDLCQVEAGKLQVDRETCSPSQIVFEALSLMRVRADAKDLSLRAEFDGKIPESIQTDPNRLRQILINLVGNAVKFTDAGSIQMVIRLSSCNAARPEMHFAVTDTGIGMSEEQMADLFKPFSQVDSSATRKFGGSGLGLAISKRLAEMLGGEIGVRSSPGKGSTFTLTISTGSLDGVRLLDSPAEAERRIEQPGKSSAQDHTTLDCRILVAEDGLDNQRIISTFLKNAGAEITVAENGQVAFDCVQAAQAEAKPFGVILMDMQMPVMDGYDAAKKLRAEGFAEPIIALTAHAMKEDRRKCLDAGCNDYMTKPVERRKLIELVAKYVPETIGSVRTGE